MALGALNEGVAARQVELCVGVLLDRKRRGSEAVLGVARIALVLGRRRGELAAMPVGVTGRASQLPRDIHGVFALGFMAIHAFDIAVFSFESERALFVGLLVKQRRLEALFVMT